MTVQSVAPYLFFRGDAEHAIRLYEKALGAEVQALSRYSEMPPSAGMCPPENLDRIMHAELRVGGARILVSDGPPESYSPGGPTSVCVELGDRAALERSFALLAEGGTVTLPLHDAFWGDRFGCLVDRFGIRWMLLCTGTGTA